MVAMPRESEINPQNAKCKKKKTKKQKKTKKTQKTSTYLKMPLVLMCAIKDASSTPTKSSMVTRSGSVIIGSPAQTDNTRG